MKKHFLLLMTIIFVCSCTQRKQLGYTKNGIQGYTHFKNNEPINIQTISENEYHSLRKQYIDLSLDTLSLVKERNDSVYLPLDNGSCLELRNNTSENHIDDYIKYNYLGFLDHFNVYVLKVIRFSNEETWFVNKSNSNIIKTLPYYCASNQHIVSYDMPDSDRYNGIEIFRWSENGLQKTDSLKPNWFVKNIFCLCENIFVVEALTFNSEDLFLKIVLQ